VSTSRLPKYNRRKYRSFLQKNMGEYRRFYTTNIEKYRSFLQKVWENIGGFTPKI
jgi:hypothetical protein